MSGNSFLRRHARELPPATALIVVLLAVLAIAPAFFSPENLRDLALNNAPILPVALGMTLVILAGEIDISVGSQFAVCSVAAGMLAKAGVPIWIMPVLVLGIGALMGALNGYLVGTLGLPSIIVTLAMLVAWRDALRWTTQGAWVQDLPANFQWFGLSASAAQAFIILIAIAVLGAAAWALRHLRSGRNLYAVGSDEEAARLAGIDSKRMIFRVFALTGALVGLGAVLNAVRFNVVPSNTGLGLELQAVAAVVVGGTAITGGRGSVLGTFIGVLLLGAIGTAMTYVGISPFWGKAIQGLIILAALVADATLARMARGNLRSGAVAAG
ncbi:MAG: ABC transporter permease [Gemmatimonadota bacterium]|nr:ABC transporter permease [Gemmatimonadota bacterium]